MKFRETALKNAYVIEPEPYEDKRGMFVRIFCENELYEIQHTKRIVQSNHSLTRAKGALRGMHYQNFPKAEIKFVKCISGSVYDVIVDIRENSQTFLHWHGEIISAENKRIIYIPEGFAHGFQTLEPDSELIYFHTEFYSPEHEGALRYNDPLINIEWPLPVTDISERDMNHSLLSEKFKGIVV